MSNVGAELKKEREAQSKTRAEVARGTGILIHHLAALEHGNFDTFPDDATVAGLVRAYAEFLGFVPDEPVAEFWKERGHDGPPPAATPVVAKPARETPPVPSAADATTDVGTRRLPWIAIVTLAVVLVLLTWWATGEGQDPDPAASGGPEPVAVETPAEPEPEALPSVPDEPQEAEPDAPPIDEAESVPPREPEPRPEPPPVASASGLTIDDYGVGAGIENRRLVGKSDRFRLGTKVWFWTRVEGGAAGDAVRHVWIHEGRTMSDVRLRVGSASWRTQSAKTMFDGSVGRWTVEARDLDGDVLARSTFVCER